MTDSGFIFMLVLGAGVLAGILATVHVSAYRLSKRLEKRRTKAAADEPEFNLGSYKVAGTAKMRELAAIIYPQMHT